MSWPGRTLGVVLRHPRSADRSRQRPRSRCRRPAVPARRTPRADAVRRRATCPRRDRHPEPGAVTRDGSRRTYRVQLARRASASTTSPALAAVPRTPSASRTSTCPRSCRPAPGSTHGYDVVDHTRLIRERRRPRGVRAAVAAPAREHGSAPSSTSSRTTWRCPTPAAAQRAALVGAARRPALAVRRLVRRRLDGRGGPCRPHAGARRSGSAKVLAAGEISVDTHRRASRCCATTSTSSRSGPAPRTCRWRELVDRAVVPARVLAGRRRGAELPPVLRRRHAWPRSGSRHPEVFDGHARAAARAGRATAG